MNKIKNSVLLAAFVLLASVASSQATLPATWDMNNVSTPPAGWTYDLLKVSGNLTYTANGFFNSSPQSLRLDGTGEFLQVNFSGRADTVEYYIRHTGSSTDTGLIFTIEESDNGSNWSAARTYNKTLPNSLSRHIVRLQSSSKYVRFFFTKKISGFNVALDDVTIKPAAASSNPEIQVFDGSTLLFNGATVQMGRNSLYPVKIKNKAQSGNLTVDSIRFTGSGASFLKIGGIQSTLAAGEETSGLIQIQGTPPTGSLKAEMMIYSNDSFGNKNYKVNLYGIVGPRASEPTVKPALSITTLRAWNIKVNTGAGDGEKVLVLVANDSITALPEDGKVYRKGEYLSGARIIHNGDAGAVNIDKIVANTNYWVAAFAWNGYDTFVNYLTSSVTQINSKSPGANPGSYYTGLNPVTSTFVADLRGKVRPHFQIFYSNYASTIVEDFLAYDTTNGQRVLGCTYSGYKHRYSPPLIWDTMSREHAYPRSWMGEGSTDSANYSDLHILFPVHQQNANAVRSNFPLNNLKTVTFRFLQGALGEDSSGNLSYEPRNEAKGLAARANFYICATYNRPGKAFTIPTSVPFVNYLQDQKVLKRWNQQFPPDNWEIARNEYVAFKQNNRNPFIDNPNWACYIDFSNMTHVPSGDCFGSGSSTGVSRMAVIQPVVSPNPASGTAMVSMIGLQGEKEIMIFDVTEKLVFKANTADSEYQLNLSQLQPGAYLIYIKSGNGHGISRLIKQ